ncbi:MAG: hypothetical protein JOZ81_12400, partial [Chloroflexi bacterium]|nr:hypothetical protein [Chloroflexota bacterium]
MTTYRKVSVSIPTDLLVLARSSQLQAPAEPLSSFFARLLREALDARDRQADQEYPPTAEEEALGAAWLRASTQDLDDD